MTMIRFQPRPHIPPIGFFEPISVDPKDMMTDVEYLLGILKKLNEMVAQINKNSEFIENYTGKIEEIESEIVQLRNEMTEFEEQINTDITTRFNAIKIELDAAIATTLIRANAYTDTVAANIQEQIESIVVGQITVFDPTTGIISPLQIVIDNLYNSSRNDALTANEYDTLELTASAYDAYELTAYEYDQSGKTLLV